MKVVYYGDLQKPSPLQDVDQGQLHACILCESDLVTIRVVSAEENLEKFPNVPLLIDEFHISQQRDAVQIEYRNLSNEIREVCAFGVQPILSRSPGFVRMTNDVGGVYEIPTYNPMQFSYRPVVPDRRDAIVVPPNGIIGVRIQSFSSGDFPRGEYPVLQFVATRSFFAQNFFPDPDNPLLAVPNDEIYGTSNSIKYDSKLRSSDVP